MAKRKVTVPLPKARPAAIRAPKVDPSKVATPGKRVTARAHSPKAMARAFRPFV